MIAFANRLHAPVQEARRLIAEGQLGKVCGVELHLVADQTRLTRKEARDQWYYSKARAGGGCLIWLGIHWVDLALHITGRKVNRSLVLQAWSAASRLMSRTRQHWPCAWTTTPSGP